MCLLIQDVFLKNIPSYICKLFLRERKAYEWLYVKNHIWASNDE